MNDVQNEADDKADGADVKAKSALPRQLALLACLAIMLGALYFDRKVARPVSEGKSQELLAAAEQRLNSDQPQLSPQEVAAVLGQSAADIEDAEHYILESYKWRAGLPWRSYDINVLYTKGDDSPRYYASYYNIMPDNDALPGYLSPKGEEEESPAPTDVADPPGAGPASEGTFEPEPGVPSSEILLESGDQPVPSDADTPKPDESEPSE